MTIRLLDIAQEDMNRPFNALINTLVQVSDPIEFTSTDTFVREAPPATPATFTFNLGGRSANGR